MQNTHETISNNHSVELFEEAKQVIPGGVNSPVRSFSGVGGNPVFMQRGEGACMFDVDGKRYIDYICSWGPLIHGHANPDVISKVQQACNNGLGFGATTPVEITIAKKITELMPNIELVRMVNSGTEATMSAIRLARGYTGRDKIIKFEGCYHGHNDSLLIKAGSGALTLGTPSSPGIPADIARHTLTADFNDLASVVAWFEKYPSDIAGIIIEPMAGNMNFIPAQAEFLQGLRRLCDEHGALLIFDEVMTGFRITSGGAQQYYDIKPDITALGKVIGGGLPVGAYGGKREIMEQMAPTGPIYQAGTLSGNPIAMTSGLATLTGLQQDNFYPTLNAYTKRLTDGMQTLADQYHIPLVTHQVESMYGFFFTEAETVTSYADVMQCDVSHFKAFFHAMLEKGVYFAPSAYECGFTSICHDEAIIDETLNKIESTFKELRT